MFGAFGEQCFEEFEFWCLINPHFIGTLRHFGTSEIWDCPVQQALIKRQRMQRLSKMELISFQIEKDEKGLGILIRLFYDPADKEEREPGVFIMEIVKGGAAHKSGKFQLFDQIINVNGTSLIGLTKEEIDSTFKKMEHSVWIQIGRESPENTKQLIKHLMKEEERKRGFLDSAKQERGETNRITEKETPNYEASTLASLWRTREIEFKKRELATKSALKKKVQKDTEFLKTAYATIAEAEAKLSIYEKKNRIRMDMEPKLEEKDYPPINSSRGMIEIHESSNLDAKNKRPSPMQRSLLVKAARRFARWFR
ncbi:neurabin-2-like [Antechinus flavipes]|uniref:neurabin-2-like n=1 Tax=Antechinus flavipes TaxID=38775 RepID=UPI002235783B|nr:neurabin-2-like [Antechinus flavipes]